MLKPHMDSKKKHVVIVDKMLPPNNVTFISEIKLNEPHEVSVVNKEHKKMSMVIGHKGPKSPQSTKDAVIKAAIRHEKDSSRRPDDHPPKKSVSHGPSKDHHPVHHHKRRHTKHHEIPVHPKPTWDKTDCEESCSCNAECSDCDHRRDKKERSSRQDKRVDHTRIRRIPRTKSDQSHDSRPVPSYSTPRPPKTLRKTKRKSTLKDSVMSNEDSLSSNEDDEDYSEMESCPSERDVDEETSTNSSEIVPLKVEKGFQPKMIQPLPSQRFNIPRNCKCGYSRKYEPEPHRFRICCCPETARIQAELREWKSKVTLLEKELSSQKGSVRKFTTQLFTLTNSLQAINRFKDTMDLNLSTLLFIATRRGEIQEFYEPDLVGPIFKRISDELMTYLTKHATLEPNPPNSDEHDKTCLLLTLAANILAAKKTWEFFTSESAMVDLLHNMFIALDMIQNVPSLQKLELILMKIMYSLTIHVETYMLVQQQKPILKCICKYIRMDHHHFKRYFGLQFAERVTRYIRDKETYSLIIKTLPMRVIDFYSDLEPNQDATDVQIVSESIIKQVEKNYLKLFPQATVQSYKAHICYPFSCPLVKEQPIYLRDKVNHSSFPGLDDQLKNKREREDASYFRSIADKHDELVAAKADLAARGKVIGRSEAQNQKKSFTLSDPSELKQKLCSNNAKIVRIQDQMSVMDKYSFNGGSVRNEIPDEYRRRATSLQSKIVYVTDRFEPVLTIPRSVTDEYFSSGGLRQSSGNFVFLYKSNVANAASQDLVLIPYQKQSNADEYSSSL
ncbi:uncharacterized protein LOC106664728 [Cimex lectularius]|uniref:Uncharacterized protein n=1 Tax=Cimex lectularius TaxID=79782 RepID=A0A8I6RQ76_CIMLE|nr:uncharacterized protein LOC106664728 [Cimex lectularius]